MASLFHGFCKQGKPLKKSQELLQYSQEPMDNSQEPMEFKFHNSDCWVCRHISIEKNLVA